MKHHGHQRVQRRPLLREFAPLFYVCKILGINSQDYVEFRQYKNLEKSESGDLYAIVFLVTIFINYNLMVWVFHDPEYSSEKDNLTIAIGFVLTYFSLFVYMADRITGLRSQRQFLEMFETLQDIEEEFKELGIKFNNTFIRHRIVFLISMITLIEAVIFIFTFTFIVDRDHWSAWLWTFTAFPTYCNSLDKVWYSGVLLMIKKRFEAINNEFDNISGKLHLDKLRTKKTYPILSVVKEHKGKKILRTSKIQPTLENLDLSNCLGEEVKNSNLYSFSASTIEMTTPTSRAVSTPFEELEDRFVKLCQLHNDLCVLAGNLNDIWGFPIVVLMGYGFFITTAQLYFFYCARADQIIPALFRPASNTFITVITLFYVAFKCVGVLKLNWLTNLESKKTGVCIHRCAVTADKNKVYEMVNHLSLKLFNHVASINVCGYFSLDMETLFGFCGGISTYLIILIQFNIEQQQVISAKSSYSKDNDTLSDILFGNVTSILSNFYEIGTDITTNGLI